MSMTLSKEAEVALLRAAAKRREEYVKVVRSKYQDDVDVEVDYHTKVSESHDGAYVSVWVWVSNDEIPKSLRVKGEETR
jgi:hypothetical protein